MSWRKRERLLGDKLVQQAFPFQCSRTMQSNAVPTDTPSFDDLAFCANTFGRGSYASIMGTGYWHFSDKSRWIYQRDFIAFRTEADRLVFLMHGAG